MPRVEFSEDIFRDMPAEKVAKTKSAKAAKPLPKGEKKPVKKEAATALKAKVSAPKQKSKRRRSSSAQGVYVRARAAQLDWRQR